MLNKILLNPVYNYNPRDPFDILYVASENKVTSIDGIDMGALGYLLKSFIFMSGLISIAIILISLFFVHKADIVAEKKKSIESKLFIMFLAASAVTLFDTLKNFFDYMFFL